MSTLIIHFYVLCYYDCTFKPLGTYLSTDNQKIVAVKITNTKNDKKWINQVSIQTTIDYHSNIIRLVGFCHTSQINLIIFEIAEDNLLTFVKNDNTNKEDDYSDSIRRIIREIILGTVFISH